MNNYHLETFSSTYPHPVTRQYSSEPYYYSYNDYPSSSLLTPPISYTTKPRTRHSVSYKYYTDDDEDTYFTEYHRRHRHTIRPHNQTYLNNQKSTRARNFSSQSQEKSSALLSENALRLVNSHQVKAEYDAKINMTTNENREHGVLKRDPKRMSNSSYKLLTPIEFLSRTSAEIKQEFRKLPDPPAKDTHASKDERNLDKIRYRDVIPGEATRVKLRSDDDDDDDDDNDFINANYVSGFDNQENAYIFTQGPLQTTVEDFWRMVWQENVSIIVMTTNIRESGVVKCYPYWPMESKEILNAGLYQIQNESSEKFDCFNITMLQLKKKNHSEIRTVYHAHYHKWPDHGVPSSTKDALAFLEKVEQYRKMTMKQAPLLLHCSAGIGRTGTFCAIDIGIKRYLEQKVIDMPSTVAKMRTERAGSVQTEDQYLFAYLAMMDYIKQHQALQERINEPVKSVGTDKSDATKVIDNRGSHENDDNGRKTSRSKPITKKSNDNQSSTNPLSINTHDKVTFTQASTLQRTKTVSDSVIQHLTPSTATVRTEPARLRSLTEQISSNSTPMTNLYTKKARK